MAKGISVIHSETASLLKYNDENSLTCTVLMAYYSAKAYYMNPLMELPSGKGFADVVYLPKRNVDKPALVVELKWDKSARGAIRQIKEKGLRRLRIGKAKRELLEKFDIAEAGLYRGGLNNYQEHNFTSIVEHLAIKQLDAEERYKQHLAEIEKMHRKRVNEV